MEHGEEVDHTDIIAPRNPAAPPAVLRQVHRCLRQPAKQNSPKSIILFYKPLDTSLLVYMTLFVKASYTIITPKQFVLVLKSISFRVVKTIPKRPKQIVLLLQR